MYVCCCCCYLLKTSAVPIHYILPLMLRIFEWYSNHETIHVYLKCLYCWKNYFIQRRNYVALHRKCKCKPNRKWSLHLLLYIDANTDTQQKKTEYKIAHEIHGKLSFCCCCGIRNLYLAWSAFNSDEFLRVTQNKNWRFFLYFLLNFWSNFSLTLGVLIASLSKFWLQICCCALRKN